MNKPFSVQSCWGSESTREENPEPCRYDFDTQAELDAFMEGVDEASGFMDYEIIEDEIERCVCHFCGKMQAGSDEVLDNFIPYFWVVDGKREKEINRPVCIQCEKKYGLVLEQDEMVMSLDQYVLATGKNPFSVECS